MRWSIEFLPFVSWSVIWALAAFGVVLFALVRWRARRGALLRALAYAMLLLAIANPHLKQVDREPLNEASRQYLLERLKTFPNLDVRWIHSASTSGDGDRDGTMLFTDLAKGLADVPPDRLAGVIMLTDGNVHDVPGNAAALGFDAPVHALITGKPGEFERRLEVLRAPRFGLVGGLLLVEVKATETTPGDAKSVKLTVTRQGEPPSTKTVRIGEKVDIPVKVDHAGPNIVEIETEAAPGELSTVNNRAVLTVER